jgi:hypothetical protein
MMITATPGRTETEQRRRGRTPSTDFSGLVHIPGSLDMLHATENKERAQIMGYSIAKVQTPAFINYFDLGGWSLLGTSIWSHGPQS